MSDVVNAQPSAGAEAPPTAAPTDSKAKAAAPIAAGKPTGKGSAADPNLGKEVQGAPKNGAPQAPAADAPPPAPAAPEKPAKVEWWKHVPGEITVDGKKKSLSFKSEQDAIAYLQKGDAADTRFKQTAEEKQKLAAKEKQFREALALIKDDPDAAFEMLGLGSFEDVALARVAKAYEKEQMTPEQRELHEYKQKVAKYEADQKAAAERAEQARVKQEEQAFHDNVTNTVLAVNEELKYDPNGVHKDFIAEVVFPWTEDIMRLAAENGMEMPPARIAAEVQRRLDTVADLSMQGLDGNALIRRLGPERVKAIARALIESKQRPAPVPTPAIGMPEDAPTPPPTTRATNAQNRERLRNLSSVAVPRAPFRWGGGR